jgi:AraC-like DNA-binding protein
LFVKARLTASKSTVWKARHLDEPLACEVDKSRGDRTHVFPTRPDVTMERSASQTGVAAFTYAGAPKGQSYEAWREGFCRGFCQLDAAPSAAGHIECTVKVTRVGSLSFGAAHGTSASFLRTRSLLSDGCDDLVLVTAAAGDVLTVQRGRTMELRPSQMCLMSLDDIAECGLSSGGRFTALRLPRPDLLAISRDSEDKLSKPLGASPHLQEIVSSYFALCAGTAASLDAFGQHTMAQHMTELVALLLRAEADDAPPALRAGYGEARLQLIQAHALRRLGDADLTIVSAARRAGLTPKQVQRLFAATGATFSEFVLEQRLLLARRRLSSADSRHAKISAVAQDAGFGDLSYFNRSFRRRFGMTPSEWRDARSVLP